MAAERLAALRAEHRGFEPESQERFVKTVHEFARKMSLPGPDPIIAFVKPDIATVQATWNAAKKQHEVNPSQIDAPGLPQYVALMGRFFDRNYDRCIGDQNSPRGDWQWWNQFRYAVVDYIIQTEETFRGMTTIGSQQPLFAALKNIEEKAGMDTTKRLAIALFNRYDCNWTRDSITSEMLKINSERGFNQEAAIRAAMSSQGFPAKKG